MTTNLEAAWAEVDAAAPPGWFVGRPSKHDELAGGQWEMFAFDPSERAKAGKREREWTAVAHSEYGVVVEMARCLREISAGRVPK